MAAIRTDIDPRSLKTDAEAIADAQFTNDGINAEREILNCVELDPRLVAHYSYPRKKNVRTISKILGH